MSKLQRYSSYKDSGIDGLGEIPVQWKISRIKNLFKFSKGLTITKENLQEEGIYCINYGEIHSKYGFEVNPEIHNLKCVNESYLQSDKNSLLGNGDFIFADTSEDIHGSGNFTYLNSDIPAFAGYHTIICRPYNVTMSRYYAYAFESLSFRSQIQKKVKGVKVYSISQSLLKDITVWLPEKEEQNKIASFLDEKTAKIDQAIRQKEQLIELLKERRQIVINEAVTKGLNPNASMKESGVEWIGEIPKDWKVSKLGVCLKPISIKNRTDLPLLSVAREQGVILRDVEDKESNHNFIPDDLSNYKMVRQGQFAMNKMKAWQGSYGISDYTGIVSPAYYIFELNGIEPSFFHKAIRSKVYVPFFTKASDGVRIGQWDLSKTRMKEIPFYIPSKDEQLLIVKHIEEQTAKIDTAIELQQKYIAKLKEYKATLIDSVVTGKVRVA